MQEITIQDVGPVEALTIPIRPGVTILRGRNDCGKSLTLDAVSRLAGGNGAVTCRDKASSGSVEGLGVKISVRQSARRSGELEALSIEGRLSIADLVSPPIKDPVAADRHRIKALLQLTGVKADVGLFGLGEFIECVTVEALKSDDLVEMAARVKRDLEAASRKKADAAEKLEVQELACKQAAEGVDLSANMDTVGLQAVLEDAIYAHGELTSKAQSAEMSKRRAAEAASKLDREANPPNVTQAEADVTEGMVAQNGAQAEVEQLERDLSAARQALCAATARCKHAEERLALERAHADAVAGWRETIDAAASVESPTPKQLADAEQAVNAAREAIEKGAIARQARAKLQEAENYRTSARVARNEAQSLRNAALNVDDALSTAVASQSLTVKAGRLVTQHPERGEIFYAERSDGTRWKLAIDEAIKRIRELGAEQTAIIPVMQAAWSELDPDNKAAIHEYAAEKCVCIVTAEAADGELRAEAFAEGGAE